MPSKRALNFGAGPSTLPVEVLKQAQDELLDFQNLGLSIMELSHRSKTFEAVLQQSVNDIKDILSVPDSHEVLLMHGGGSGQFAAIPLNLCPKLREETADYLVTGAWSEKAAKEAQKFVQVNHVAPPSKTGPAPFNTWKFTPGAKYFYYCENETIGGVEFQEIPKVPEGTVICCDMSSNIMTHPIDVSKYGVIFAGAQKNLGIAGVTLVIVRKDLIGEPAPVCPVILSYKTQSANKNLYNTPPTYALYIMGLVLQWIKKNGGIEGMSERSAAKSKMLYQMIEQSNGFYCSMVDKECRSRINVPFRVRNDEELEKKFLAEARALGMIELNGHRSVGGIRASMYNAMSVSDVEQLLALMRDFQKRHA